jgi:anaerobic C4-dicarboxylate transporter DcuA
MIWIQFAILITAILIGARMKGIGLGVMGMVGLLIFVFVFKMKLSDPPIDVMLIIFAVVATAATLQAAGGMDYLVGIAEKILRSKTGINYFAWTISMLFIHAICGHLAYYLFLASYHCGSGHQKKNQARTTA